MNLVVLKHLDKNLLGIEANLYRLFAGVSGIQSNLELAGKSLEFACIECVKHNIKDALLYLDSTNFRNAVTESDVFELDKRLQRIYVSFEVSRSLLDEPIREAEEREQRTELLENMTDFYKNIDKALEVLNHFKQRCKRKVKLCVN
jgi:hypothetical protein